MESFQVVVSLIGIVVVIFLCYYVTYYVSVKASGQGRGRQKNKNINLLDRFSISKDKSFCIVEIAGKIYVIGVTNQSMTVIDTLDAAAFNEAAAERRDAQTWSVIPGGKFTSRLTKKLADWMSRKMGRKTGNNDKTSGANFTDNMRAAQEKTQSGGPDNIQAERTEDPGVDE